HPGAYATLQDFGAATVSCHDLRVQPAIHLSQNALVRGGIDAHHDAAQVKRIGLVVAMEIASQIGHSSARFGHDQVWSCEVPLPGIAVEAIDVDSDQDVAQRLGWHEPPHGDADIGDDRAAATHCAGYIGQQWL